MKIWCVDWSALSHSIHSELFFTLYEAENFYDSLFCGCYRKMYQVEDIWGWCARHFERVITEIVTSRDSGDDFTYIWGMVNEIKEAAAHCGLTDFVADMVIARDAYDCDDTNTYVLTVAWFYNGKLHHYLDKFEGLDCQYDCPTLVEKRTI